MLSIAKTPNAIVKALKLMTKRSMMNILCESLITLHYKRKLCATGMPTEREDSWARRWPQCSELDFLLVRTIAIRSRNGITQEASKKMR